ncbi:hypothetical protein G7068_11775 [Leucobacter viscericola]|uniref:Uncharacterized protein n=1 Tax=Leucobacter viscericola TaxID=2714935 RepID=A0A6G7XHD2_9MICO|nr:hypothetical protein [Leucobacter viscericola]QIK63787.1 hypothetical protein G7068_11775 [Leucobacter viscericola]
MPEKQSGFFVTRASPRQIERIYNWMGEDIANLRREGYERMSDGSLSVPARFAGGAVQVLPASLPDGENSAMVELDLPGTGPVPFFPTEARALGQALIDVAEELRRDAPGSIKMTDLPGAIQAALRAEELQDD